VAVSDDGLPNRQAVKAAAASSTSRDANASPNLPRGTRLISLT